MSFETGKIGRQAGGAVVARTGDTIVYSTACADRTAVPTEFTPLRVDFFARYRYDNTMSSHDFIPLTIRIDKVHIHVQIVNGT